ncbi:hypothetical protein [Anaerotalea alkaliphila]|uniref:Uncharacterized protein n=1 Tax=Anaerotalea alkaliphila TaxID=2662126 RepID=A0A7X5HTT4_9FIRM|nr:hypothetical protein [Anaerotalea alkaliphila]NDL66533.1 hypothetical protein [Anaerotalea alkaliphila]
MEEIIKKIIDIEYQAQAVLDEAKELKEQTDKELQEKLKALKLKSGMDAKLEIERYRQQELKEFQRFEEREAEKTQKILRAMEDRRREMADKWKEELVESVLKR